jgi:hypothetical protein
MKLILAKTLLTLAALAIALFVADYAVLRYRIAASRNPYGNVTVYVYYSIAEKNRKTEYVPSNSENDTCVHSLFAHRGFSPCWYLARHPEKRIEM